MFSVTMVKCHVIMTAVPGCVFSLRHQEASIGYTMCLKINVVSGCTTVECYNDVFIQSLCAVRR